MTCKIPFPEAYEKEDPVAGIYEKYGADMKKTAKAKLRDSANAEYDAEEAVQNAFIRIIEKRDYARFHGSEELHAYLMMVVANEAAKILQKQSGEIETCELSDDICKEEDFFTKLLLKSEAEQVMRAMMRLKDRYRTVLTLYCVEELTVQEISERLGMKRKTVYTNISRGRVLLLRMMEQEAVREKYNLH